MRYIESQKPDQCVLCKKNVAEDHDEENYILLRGEHTFIILNIYPYTNGHLMVVPYMHTSDLNDLPEPALTEMMLLVRKCVNALHDAMNPMGFNIGMNLGRVAGAGIDDHVHMHVVPRWQGDANFMPVISDTRMIPETLADTYTRLRPFFTETEKP